MDDPVDATARLIAQRYLDYLFNQHKEELQKLYTDSLVFGLTEEEIRTRMDNIFASKVQEK